MKDHGGVLDFGPTQVYSSIPNIRHQYLAHFVETMESNQEEAGSIQNDSKEKLKAHVDCSNGINDTTLLAACLGVSQEKKFPNETDINEALEDLYFTIFGEKISFDSLTTRKTVVIPTESKCICIVVNPPPATITLKAVFDAYTRIFSAFLVKFSEYANIPEWVSKTAERVFGEITNSIVCGHRSWKETSSQELEEARPYIFHVFATLLCLDSMGIREVTCSPLPMIFSASSNFSDGDAVSILQEGMETDPSKTVHFDQTTPPASVVSTAVGIALLKVLTGATRTSQRSRMSPMVVQKYGFGIDYSNENLKVSIVIGTNEEYETDRKSITEQPGTDRQNINSVVRESSLFHSDHVAHLETNLDDISGESLAFAIELLLSHGAIDAWVTPIVMKKGRPAHTLHCLCKDNDLDEDSHTLDKLLRLIFQHTSTLGVRIYRSIPRKKLDRTIVTVTTPFENTSREGKVDVKVSSFKNGEVVRKKAEFDHCKEIAIETGVGVQEVARQAIKKYDEIQMNEA